MAVVGGGGGGGRALWTPLDASVSLSLQRRGVGVPVPPGFGDLRPQVLQDPPHPPGPAAAPAPGLCVQPPGTGLLCPPASLSVSCRVNSRFTSATASFFPGRGTMPPAPPAAPRSATQGWSYGGWGRWDTPKPPGTSAWWHLALGGGTCQHWWGLRGAPRWASPWGHPLPAAPLPG